MKSCKVPRMSTGQPRRGGGAASLWRRGALQVPSRSRGQPRCGGGAASLCRQGAVQAPRLLVHGVLHQLAAVCVGPLQPHCRRLDPTLTPTSLHVAVGGDEFELRWPAAAQCISVHLLTDATEALAVFDGHQILLAAVLEAHYCNFKATYLIPLPGDDQEFVDRTSL